MVCAGWLRMSGVPLMNARFFGPLSEILEEIGGHSVVSRAWDAVGLSQEAIEGRPVFIPYRLQADFLESAARQLGIRHMGALMGQRLEYPYLDIYADYVLSAPNLVGGLTRGTKALNFIISGAKVHWVLGAGYLRVQFESGIGDAIGARHISEGIPLLLIDLVRRYVGPQWRPAWVELDERTSSSMATTLEETYQVPVVVGAAFPAIPIPVNDLTAPNRSFQAARTAILFDDLRALVRSRPPSTMTGVVREMVSLNLRLGDPSEDGVARRLCMGHRTIQRRLRVEGTSFREVRQQVLEQRARQLLSESEHSIAEIADALGYEEVNSFRRAFEQWAGLSPTQFRETLTQR